jgi:hypothetical protein
MSEILTFSIEELTPARDAVLVNQGIPPGRDVSSEIDELCTRAIELLLEIAEPNGILREISAREFAGVYAGQGENEPQTPVGDVFPRAESLALFVVTIGPRATREITERFAANDLALGAMLDSAASAAADKLAAVAERRFAESLAKRGEMSTGGRVLGYSPGYCGWHISGQRKLFDFLKPEQIGVTLTDSFLMQPLKSVSGVLIAAPKEIHNIRATYQFCSRCKTRGCSGRAGASPAE